MSESFAKNCDGCKFSQVDFSVVSVGRDDFVSDGWKLCMHPKNYDERYIPFLFNCPWRVVE